MAASLTLRTTLLPSPLGPCTACLPPRHARIARSRPIAPLNAQPSSSGNADRGGDASSSGQADSRDLDDELGSDPTLDLAANSWPRIVLDEVKQSRDYRSREPPRAPAEQAKSREAFLLRLATLGFAAVLLGERLTGRGVVEALGHPTGIPLAEMDVALGLLAGALLVGGLVPTTVLYDSVNEEVPGIFDDIPTLIGRASCVLLGLNIISEVITGKGALGLLSVETGTQYVSEIEGGLVFLLLIFITNTKSKT